MAHSFWDPSEGRYGLFDPWSFKRLEALVASGLGGGSLIYANVLIRKDPAWFREEDRDWPVSAAALEEHYDEAERMLGATPYPFDREPYSRTPKTRELKGAAERLGLDWTLPKLAVSFTPAGSALGVPIDEPEGNLHAAPRFTCRLCGECDIGCNLGSKNTLDFNYLSAAKREGADIRVLSQVRTFEPRRGNGAGWKVQYDQHDPEARKSRRRTLTAKRLILSAGTFGSTYLMLRNRDNLDRVSPALGSRFSGNGDFLSFARECRAGDRLLRIDPSRGPVITMRIRYPDALDGGEGRGFYIEDAGWPQFVNWVVHGLDVTQWLWRIGYLIRELILRRFQCDPKSQIGGEASRLIGNGGLTDATLGLLSMGRDVPDGSMRLGKRGRLALDWTAKTSRPYVDELRKECRRLAKTLGGDYLDNPTWKLGRRVITTHPLGGCPMGADESEGVVDPYGRVYGADHLYIADGSVMPGPVGANPALTIAALSERFAAQIVDGEGAGRDA
jgi:cholesterol oxidase